MTLHNIPPPEHFERRTKYDGRAEIGAGSPKLLESRFERPSYQMTALERMLIEHVAKKISGTTNPFTPEGRIREIAGLETTVDNYIFILEACDKETGDHSYGYTTFRREANPQYDQGRELLEKILTSLTGLTLVTTNGNQVQKYEVIEILDANNNVLGTNKDKPKTSKFYAITSHGQQLLQEHRKAKSEQK